MHLCFIFQLILFFSLKKRFFKNRHWLFTEFPELSSDGFQQSDRQVLEANLNLNSSVMSSSSSLRKDEEFPGQNSSFLVFEVGCGVGNTIFPLLEKNCDPNLFVYGCDFSSKAIEIVQESLDYSTDRSASTKSSFSSFLHH